MIEHRDHGRQILELEYQILNEQMNQLLKSRASDRHSVEEIHRWRSDLSARRSPADLIQHLAQSESLICLHAQTSDFRNQYRRLQTRMADLGQRLGYW